MSPLAWVGLIMTTVGEIVQFIRWLDGDDVPKPALVSRVPAASQSTLVRMRQDNKARRAFETPPPT